MFDESDDGPTNISQVPKLILARIGLLDITGRAISKKELVCAIANPIINNRNAHGLLLYRLNEKMHVENFFIHALFYCVIFYGIQ
ncbi:MAG: hypothetical protein QG589_145 [Patescibacteria group bacterium]|nr:hypothetical protein [Patescibacteria group bacterium]